LAEPASGKNLASLMFGETPINIFGATANIGQRN
jgi:hypothetical protein